MEKRQTKSKVCGGIGMGSNAWVDLRGDEMRTISKEYSAWK
jgi:hypothetical protein